MSIYEDIKWFKTQFGGDIQKALADTPFSLDLVSAIAYQESAEVWSGLHAIIPSSELLALCVGDVIGAPSRDAFPKTAEALQAVDNGPEMYAIARQALADMAAHVHAYQPYVNNPERFCHAFGIFQYDIQAFTDDPDYFLQKQWASLEACLSKLKGELVEKLHHVYGPDKTTLTDTESVYVAIAYNSGGANVNGSFNQGYKDSDGNFYGQMIWQYLQTAKSIVVPDLQPPRRLILAKASDAGEVYEAMASATFNVDHFDVDKAEVAAFIGSDLEGPDRSPIHDILANNSIAYQVSADHINDTDDPRVYVFLQ